MLLHYFDVMIDQEHNISTFLLEMKEIAFICNSTTDRSLFLLDELGRATSNEDGVAIAWAVSEYLLTKRDMVSFYIHRLLRSSLLVHTPLIVDSFLQDIFRHALPPTCKAGGSVPKRSKSASWIANNTLCFKYRCKHHQLYTQDLAWPMQISRRLRG